MYILHLALKTLSCQHKTFRTTDALIHRPSWRSLHAVTLHGGEGTSYTQPQRLKPNFRHSLLTSRPSSFVTYIFDIFHTVCRPTTCSSTAPILILSIRPRLVLYEKTSYTNRKYIIYMYYKCGPRN